MSNKTISINPNLFSIGGSKTRKNKDKKQNTTVTPLISPNVLKNRFLKRIKEHKQRETQNLENNQRKLPTHEETLNKNVVKDDLVSYTDEFSNSINYLQTLSKQKKVNDEKLNYEKQKIKRKEDLERKTVRNYHQPHVEQSVNIDLPEELTRPLIVVNTTDTIQGGAPFNLQSKTQTDNIPYGILKGGLKPTYHDWVKTQRNNIVTNPQAALTIQGGNLTREKTERENRLSNLREKLKKKQIEEDFNKGEVTMIHTNLIQQPNIQQPNIQQPNIMTYTNNVVDNVIINDEIIATKKITKKTIKRKYTLGKSKIKKTIGVLVKDRGTRKLILSAQKDLKRKSINDVKEYLRDHNLIKIGSNAPNDVLRKLYESAMLSGEITNSNSEILLHNFSKDDKEL
jgi:hypothetical protein